MTPSEQSQYLYNKFYSIPLYIKTVTQCCNIAIDLVIMNIEPSSVSSDEIGERIKYWKEVKEEVKKLSS